MTTRVQYTSVVRSAVSQRDVQHLRERMRTDRAKTGVPEPPNTKLFPPKLRHAPHFPANGALAELYLTLTVGPPVVPAHLARHSCMHVHPPCKRRLFSFLSFFSLLHKESSLYCSDVSHIS